MKTTFQSMLVMLALSAGMTASAQVFQKLAQTQNEELFMPLHRGGIAVADINNDGKIDIADFVTILNMMAEK